ncbi:hypothetical protein BGX34_004882 [Mortierella sp. NVP85]|nr:hypothetical protein BGX34_004882 [Mortierella sp. NVP85]
MSPSTSFSSRLSSFSTVSLALSISSFSLGSDGEGYNSSTFQSSKKQKKKKKLSKKEKEQQKQQQRCLCFLEATRMDQENDLPAAPEPKPQASIYRYQKETNRLKKMWNESTIFHWTKSRSQPLEQQQQPQQQPQQHGYDFSAQPSYIQHSHHLADEMHGVPMRNSLSGTDISDEGNHTLSDAEDEDDSEPSSIEMGRPSHISFQEHFGSKARMPRPGDDLKAISRHQAALSQQASTDFTSYRMNDLPSASNPLESRPLASAFVVEEEDDDEDLDWDAQSVQSDSGAPSSSPMYSAEAREPTSYSTVTLPLSPPAKSHLRKPSTANLRGRHRGMSLPGDSSSPFLKNKENWDDDFDFAGDINVPTKVVENQMSLQMDLDNIKDFASQIEDLKVLRTSLRKASSSLKESNIKNHQHLFELFQKDCQRDWEQAEVIINLGEIAQTSDATTSTGPVAAGPLSLLSGKSSKSSISRASSQRLRRPALSTTTGGLAPAAITTTFDMTSSLALDPKSRSLSQSSTLTGTTLAGSESDLPSRTSSRSSTETSICVESTVEDLVITPTLEKRRPYLGAGVEPLQQASLMKASTSCPAGFGQCTTPVTPLPRQYQEINEDATGELNYGLNDVEPNRSWKQHGKEDSSETIKGVPRGDMMPEVDASLRRYQKSSKKMKRATYPKLVEYDNEDEDDGYESYGPGRSSSSGSGSRGEGSSSSISMITPIPSDRHMQVLKDILVEGLGTDVAGKYMFKHGEQDHVRFSVEVIPGLLGHLKGLQERLVDQLEHLNQMMKHQEQLVAAV